MTTVSHPESSMQDPMPCKHCGAPVYPSAWRRKTFASFYCSRECYNADVSTAVRNCAQCGIEFKGRRSRKYCSHACAQAASRTKPRIPKIPGQSRAVAVLSAAIASPEFVGEFWDNVKKSDIPGDCWPWQGAVHSAGYGRTKFAGSPVAANRAALSIKLGRALRSDEHACHSCDNPICCNPDHLWIGSSLDNLTDAQMKGLLASGDNHWTRRQDIEADGPISDQRLAEVVRELVRIRAAVDEALKALGMAA